MTGEALALVSDVLVRATPLALTGLAVAIAFRGGVWNIGADGQFLAGATLAAWIGVMLGATHAALPLALSCWPSCYLPPYFFMQLGR